MNAYGTRRHLYDPKVQIQPPMDNTTISLQMGTNKGASQVRITISRRVFVMCVYSCDPYFLCPSLPPPPQAGMTAPGTRRAIYDQKLGTDKCDNSTMSLQMGYSQGANQSGQNFGLGRQIYDAKYCPKAGEVAEDQNGAGVVPDYIPDFQDEGYQGYQEEEQVYREEGTDY